MIGRTCPAEDLLSARPSVPDPGKAPPASGAVVVNVVDRSRRVHEAIRIEVTGRKCTCGAGQHAVVFAVVGTGPIPPLPCLPPRGEQLVNLVATAAPGERDRRGGCDSVVRHFDRFVVALGQLSLARRRRARLTPVQASQSGPYVPSSDRRKAGILFRPGVTGVASIERMFDTSQMRTSASTPKKKNERAGTAEIGGIASAHLWSTWYMRSGWSIFRQIWNTSTTWTTCLGHYRYRNGSEFKGDDSKR
jgi:hypothetical protein